jgi:peptidoglycan hydrolase-like protein with peptidoglycan-binding domain
MNHLQSKIAVVAIALSLSISSLASSAIAAPISTLKTHITRQTNITTRQTLEIGDQGSAVEELQIMLWNCGHYRGPIDGNFNTRVRAAVIRFQRHYNLEDDGRVGRSTRAVLRDQCTVIIPTANR